MDFNSIYEQHKCLMYEIAKSILNDSIYAQDAVQNAAIKISKHIDLISSLSSEKVKTLVVTIIRHAAIDVQRSRDRHWDQEVSWVDIPDLPVTNISSVYESSLYYAMQKLPFQYREVLILKYVSDLEDDEIASILDISRVNVRKRISRGKKQLEIILKKEGAL